MTNQFTYTTYIKSTPEKVWQGITNPEFTRQYWGHDNLSDWKVGSTWQHVSIRSKQTNIVGKVLESNPPKRLVVSWANPSKLEDESQVTYEITQIEDLVRLDVTHTGLSEDMGRSVLRGWPLVLSSLKSFLETGTSIETMDVLQKSGTACSNAA
jgi:uncharacterized protein YndB with AHSA1/START domain